MKLITVFLPLLSADLQSYGCIYHPNLFEIDDVNPVEVYNLHLDSIVVSGCEPNRRLCFHYAKYPGLLIWVFEISSQIFFLFHLHHAAMLYKNEYVRDH